MDLERFYFGLAETQRIAVDDVITAIIEHGRSYFLFDKNYYMGRSNIKILNSKFSEETIDNMLVKDTKSPFYKDWQKSMQDKGF